jgi:hypothetical protein
VQFAESLYKGELEEFVQEDLLMQMKLGRSTQHRGVIDKYGQIFLEEFSHFMRINELLHTFNSPPPQKLPSQEPGWK